MTKKMSKHEFYYIITTRFISLVRKQRYCVIAFHITISMYVENFPSYVPLYLYVC